ncbi:hypothetical protein L9F63_022820, partial [Diploptera punctata]
MAVEFGTGKTIFILAIVVGCFAVLWPKLFYPMLQASVNPRTPLDNTQASTCCDVMFDTDVNAIKIVSEMCINILQHHDDIDPKLVQAFKQGKLSKAGVETCREEVYNKCGVDITAFLHENVRLGKTYKQILDEIRSFNSSICLKLNFGIAMGELGAPRTMRVGALHMPSHHRQERPPHLRPDMLHPALRERGRAIPQSHIVPRVVEKEGRPGPIPGMRPPMGGAGHVVPAPKGSGTMGIVMPIYTIGIVVFFMYTIMKVMFKKPGQSSVHYGDFSSDPEFRKMVFSDEYVEEPTNTYGDQSRQKIQPEPSHTWKTTEENGTKLVVTAISGLLAEVDLQREILEKRAEEQSEQKGEDKTTSEMRKEVEEIKKIITDDAENTDKVDNVTESDKPKVQVLGMEQLPAAKEDNDGAGLPLRYLVYHLTAESQLLVSESETQAVAVDPEELDIDAPVILSGKMTLSLISLEAALAAEDEQLGQKEPVLDTPLDEKQKLQELESALREDSAPGTAGGSDEEEEEQQPEMEKDQEETHFEHMNNAGGDGDDAPSTTNYSTASAAAEAIGPEETAADYSALESFADQQKYEK